MAYDIAFFAQSILLGIGLAMDAFSVSLANGLHEPRMKGGRMGLIAGIFCGFQTLMPLLGWLAVHTILETFRTFQKFIPWIALLLLLYIGGKMLLEGLRYRDGTDGESAAGPGALLVQGIATSIDALSVGFTMAEYAFPMALAESVIIGTVTFGICFTGLALGKKFGTRLSGKAGILGGLILIAIGIEIFIQGIV